MIDDKCPEFMDLLDHGTELEAVIWYGVDLKAERVWRKAALERLEEHRAASKERYENNRRAIQKRSMDSITFTNKGYTK